MADKERVEALHHALTNCLHGRMTAEGWLADPTGDLDMGDGVVGLFRHLLNDDFAVTAWFAWLGDLPPLQVDTVIGVSCQRSYRVWPYLLGGYPHSELRIGVDDLGDGAGLVSLWELDEVDEAADQLVTPVLGPGVGWAERFASFEALLAAIRSSENPEAELYDIPVVLAAAGMPEAARDALAVALASSTDKTEEPLRSDFANKFRLWLAAGTPPLPPDDQGSLG